jgi:CheY-like chemotaxis protein
VAIDARLLLVDENDDILDGLSAWISGCPGFQVAGVAHSAREVYERVFLLSPDIILMDATLPDANALDVTRRLKTRAGAPLVILMTFHDITAVRVKAKSAGADACLSKPEITDDFPRVAGELWRERQARVGPGAVRQRNLNDIGDRKPH